jgi:hypothetical protein
LKVRLRLISFFESSTDKFQGLWKVDRAISVPEAEAALKFLAKKFGGDTGTMLVRCDVLRTIAEKNPDRRYLVETSYYFGPPNPPRKFQYDFFRTRIDSETKNYECEDFYF